MRRIPELVCPAGNLPALKTAVDNGADTVYMGLKDATNARNFPGLNFDMKSAQEGMPYNVGVLIIGRISINKRLCIQI